MMKGLFVHGEDGHLGGVKIKEFLEDLVILINERSCGTNEENLGIWMLLEPLRCKHEKNISLAHPCRENDQRIVLSSCCENGLLIEAGRETFYHSPA